MNSPTDRRHSKLAMRLQCLLLGRGSRRLLNVYRNKTLVLGRGEELLDIQRQKLTAILQHAATHVPFYRERLRLAGFGNAKDVTADLLPYVPVLKREDLQLSHEDLRAQTGLPNASLRTAAAGQPGRPSASGKTRRIGTNSWPPRGSAMRCKAGDSAIESRRFGDLPRTAADLDR